MRVLVTGGAGFLGSHLVERLEAEGNTVTAPRRADCDLTDATQAASPRRDRQGRPLASLLACS